MFLKTMKKIIVGLKKLINRSNDGFSLVELLVAIMIGTIVSASIASLLVMSLRLYGKQTVDVEMQQEMQTTSNMIIDSIMESDSFIVAKSEATKTDVAVLGRFEFDSINTKLKFSGYVFCSDNVDISNKDGKLYMKKYSSTDLTDDCINTGEIVPDKVIDELGSSVVGQEEYLLGSCVQVFNLTPATDSIQGDKYSNPFLVKLDLQFAKNAVTGDIKKELHDTIAIRDTLHAIDKSNDKEMTPVCIKNDAFSGFVSYYQPSLTSKGNPDEELEIVTEDVQMEEYLGYIQTPGGSGSFDILEIVPDYSCDYVQYSIGGKNGECFNFDNVTYGDSEFDRMTPNQLMDYVNSHYDQYNAPYFYQNGNELKTLIPVYDYQNSKYNIVNNELLKLHFFKEQIEAESGKTIYPTRGIWDEATKKYYEPNYSALKKWEERHSVTLNVCIPKDLKNNPGFIQNADMIIIAVPADEGFKTATTWYNNVKGTSRSATTTSGGDITFDEALAIYKRVADNKASIACPSALDNDSAHPNLNALFKMLYRVRDKAVSGTDDGIWPPTYNSNISNGSGRDAFRTVTSFGQVEDYLTIMRDQKYNPNYVTPSGYDFLYAYDYNGAAFPSVYKNQLIYNNESVLLTFISSGEKGLLGLVKANTGATEKEVTDVKDTFGEVEILGAAFDDAGRHVPNRWPWGIFGQDDAGETITDVGTYYRFDVVELKNPVEIMDGSERIRIDKAISINEYELEQIKNNSVTNGIGQTHNLRVFCMVNSTADLDTEINLKVNGVIVPSPLHNDMKDELVSKYKTVPGTTIEGKQVHRTLECRADLDIPDGAAINVFDKYIKVTAEMNVNGKAATGTDYALIIVRDLFDLD